MSQPETELETEETTDDAVMEQLARKREAAEEGEDEDEEVEVEAEQEESAEEEEQAEVDDDPEYDLGEVKAKKSEILAWKQGEMKDADYRRKTAEVGDAKRAVQAKEERIEQERTHYANQLDVLIGQMTDELVGSQQHLAQLAIDDPGEWVRQNAYHQARFGKLQNAVAERQALQQRTDEAAFEKKQERIQRELGALLDAIPEWKDSSVKQRELNDVDAFLRKQGYRDADMEVFLDHRVYLLARQAWKAEQQAAARASAKDKQVQKVPPKPLKAGAAQTQPKANSDAYQSALKRAKSGKEEDVMALLAAKRRNA